MTLKALADLVMVVDDVLTPEQCANMIERFESTRTGGPYFRTSRWEWEQDYREFLELNVGLHDQFGDINLMMYNTTVRMYDFYREKTGATFLPGHGAHGYESPRMKKYQANDHDQFGLHADVGDHASAKRALAMFVYLNDVVEGGETEFFGLITNGETLKVTPKAGRMVIFPPMWMFPHKGNKPVSNDKYIISSYIHYT